MDLLEALGKLNEMDSRLSNDNFITADFVCEDLDDGFIAADFICEDCCGEERLTESVDSSKPVATLSNSQVREALEKIGNGTFFYVGYFNEVTDRCVAAQYRGGRGSEGMPRVRVFKAMESLGSCGQDYENKQGVKELRAAGVERQGMRYEVEREEGAMGKKVMTAVNTQNDMIQFYPGSDGTTPYIKTKYFISIDDGDLEEIAKADVIRYFTKSAASPRPWNPNNPNNLILDRIYWMNQRKRDVDLGHSIIAGTF